MGKFRVYIDPYSANLAANNVASDSGNQYYVVGYKGTSPYDAGLFYCPYVPLQMVRAVGENSFQFQDRLKTRYGIVANPFAEGTAGATPPLGRLHPTPTATIVALLLRTSCDSSSHFFKDPSGSFFMQINSSSRY